MSRRDCCIPEGSTGDRDERRGFLAGTGRALLLGLLFILGIVSVRRPGYAGRYKDLCIDSPGCRLCPEFTGCSSVEALAAMAPNRGLVTGDNLVWQLDPDKCVKCGQCAVNCVITESAVKCVHSYAICGYCRMCFGYFIPGARNLNEGAENQMCPNGALGRRFVEEPYYEYTVDEAVCMACGKCVKGCNTFGNGSLFLQVRHDRCNNCNECSIARDCPADAYSRVSASSPYLLRKAARTA
jgi:electron transport complex protein RnfB